MLRLSSGLFLKGQKIVRIVTEEDGVLLLYFFHFSSKEIFYKNIGFSEKFCR